MPTALSLPVRLGRGLAPFSDGRVLVMSAASLAVGSADVIELTPE
jgi:hypothetical protein